MIRCCSKFLSHLPSHSRSPSAVVSRIYVLSSAKDTTQRRYASGGAEKPKTFKKIFYSTVGITLIGVGGAVVFAKNDPRFRRVLESYIPGSDKLISFIYQEDGSFKLESITEQFSTVKEKALSFSTDIYKQISGEEIKEDKPLKKAQVEELRSDQTIKAIPKPAIDKSKKPPVAVNVSNETVESNLKGLANEALKLYNSAIASVKDGGLEIIELIDKSVESVDQKSWNEIRKRVDENKKVIENLENTMKVAGEKLKQFSSQLKNSKLPADVVENLTKMESDVNKAKAKLEELKNSRLGASTKYFNKIEDARKHFSEELTALFPSVRLTDKQLKLSEDEIDLFLYYAVQKLMYYQKELNKLETLTLQRLKKAIQESKSDGSVIQETIDLEVDKARRAIKEEFDRKVLELKGSCDQEIHNQLKRQEQVHIDLLGDQLKLKEKEVERKLIQRLDDRLLEEQGRLQAELADMTGRMQGLNDAISKRALQDQKAQTSQALWGASEALYSSLKHSDKGSNKDWSEKLEPLAEKVNAIKNASAKGDDLVETVLATIPACALKRGVYPEDALRDRFMKVERVAWQVAGVPAGGTTLPQLFAAWLQSTMIIRAADPIPAAELNNEPFDVTALNNYDIIQRARYFVDRGDFEQALRYMNQLKGGARSVSLDWMREVTMLLETQQAASVLIAHAAASGMVYS